MVNFIDENLAKMIKSLRYPILALFFVILLKLIQVTAFDAKKYANTKDDLKEVFSKKTKKSKELPKQEIAKTDTSKKVKAKNLFLDELKENYLKPIQDELPPDGLRKDIFIRYYRHNKDGIGVYKLEEIGYYMHQKPATETAGLGSNIIYYGDNVPLQDIQIVTLTLLVEGIPIKSIEHTKFEWKSNAIEIGTDTSLLDKPVLTEEEIQDFHKLYLGSSY